MVIAGPLLRVRQHLVGFVHLLKAFFGLLVTGIAVGVVLHGQFAISAFDLARAGVAGDTQDLIIIFIFHSINS